MGESFGPYSFGADKELMRHISSANVAGGFHAGDPHVMRETVALAREHGVAVGLHNGYGDLVGFGRREIKAAPEELRDELIYQLGALREFALLYCMQSSKTYEIAQEMGQHVAREFFADREYNDEGQIVFTRRVGEELDPEEVAERVLRGVTQGRVRTVEGNEIEVAADSICVHSDTPGAARLAETIVRKLGESGIEVRPVGRAEQRVP
jgi:UPF0271 protein